MTLHRSAPCHERSTNHCRKRSIGKSFSHLDAVASVSSRSLVRRTLKCPGTEPFPHGRRKTEDQETTLTKSTEPGVSANMWCSLH